jgi:hypothetical protein
MSEHLREHALAATPEMKTSLRNAAELAMHLPWEKPGDSIPFEHKQTFKDLATPAAILALLDELEDSHKAYELLFKENAELRKDADRYRWLRDNRTWSLTYRIKPGKSIEYRMLDNGDWWGSWWPTHEQAIDHARFAAKGEES